MENETGEKKPKIFTKKITVIFIIATVLTIAISFTLGFFTKKWTAPDSIDTLEWVIKKIDKHYYHEEDGEIKQFTTEDYVNAIVDGLLDDYSNYYDKQTYSDLVSTNRGNYFGVGITYLTTEETAKIYGVIGNSPADKAGLKAGDVLKGAKAEGQDRVDFANKEQVFEFIDARKENEEFIFYFIRNGGSEQSVTVKRSVFISSYVEYKDSEITGVFRSEGKNPLQLKEIAGGDASFANDVAYISLSQFEGGAGDQIEQALSLMVSRGRTRLILDMRDNGGGDMMVLCQIASCFIKQDNALVAYSVGKNGEVGEFKTGKSKFKNEITSISVLADGGSASATESLIGAMLYYKDCFDIDKLIIEKTDGQAKTFGKGIMQTTYKHYGAGDAIKLTTAYIYQPDKSTCIHGVGIVATPENGVEKGQALNRALAIV